MSHISGTKLSYWRRLASGATPGPWSADSDAIRGGDLFSVAWASSDATGSAYIHFASGVDREFILTAREAVPALLAERDALLALLRELGVAPESAHDEQDEAEWQIAQRER